LSGSVELLTAKLDISTGVALHETMFGYSYVALADASLNAVEGLSVIAKQQLLIDLSAGEVLKSNMLSKIPDVAYGSDVQVISTFGTVTITALATALNEAEIGQLVRVLSQSSQQEYVARVIGKNQAVVL
jgi:flagella basal body P-ring formation protein FlgA